MKILVVGAGAWGTALALSAAPRHEVSLGVRDAAQLSAMREQRENRRYLPGLTLPPTLDLLPLIPHGLHRDGSAADLVVVATPMAGLRATLEQLRKLDRPVAWLCKGFELPQVGQASPVGHGLMAHEVCEQVAPGLAAGTLSGPSFAIEVARGQPAALVAASQHESVRTLLVSAFHGQAMRVYANDDIVGVEVGGAVKNVLAIATGLCDGLQLGLNARAALITRGLAEMSRFGLALGARAETFMGLSGLGDLVLTATGDLSRNRRVGQLLAAGQDLAQALASLGHVAEGVHCARTVLQRAGALGVEMPITRAVVELLDGRLSPRQAVGALMSRTAASESS